MKCPHCNSELTYKLTQYKNENDKLVKIHRCINCQGNIVVPPKESIKTKIK
jgi:hypothetical protein